MHLVSDISRVGYIWGHIHDEIRYNTVYNVSTHGQQQPFSTQFLTCVNPCATAAIFYSVFNVCPPALHQFLLYCNNTCKRLLPPVIVSHKNGISTLPTVSIFFSIFVSSFSIFIFASSFSNNHGPFLLSNFSNFFSLSEEDNDSDKMKMQDPR